MFKQKAPHENNMSVAMKFSSSKPQKLTKSHDMTRSTFSKLTGTFNLCQLTQNQRTIVVLWQPISRELNRNECTCGQNCTVKCPKSRMKGLLLNVHLSGFLVAFTFDQNNSCLTRFFIQKITSKTFTPVNSSLSGDGERKGSSFRSQLCS